MRMHVRMVHVDNSGDGQPPVTAAVRVDWAPRRSRRSDDGCGLVHDACVAAAHGRCSGVRQWEWRLATAATDAVRRQRKTATVTVAAPPLVDQSRSQTHRTRTTPLSCPLSSPRLLTPLFVMVVPFS